MSGRRGQKIAWFGRPIAFHDFHEPIHPFLSPHNPLVSGGATSCEDCDLLGKRHSGLAPYRLENDRHKRGGEPRTGKAHLIGVYDPPLRYDVEIVGVEGLLASVERTPALHLCAPRPEVEPVFQVAPLPHAENCRAQRLQQRNEDGATRSPLRQLATVGA
jgi:hypothetical protein